MEKEMESPNTTIFRESSKDVLKVLMFMLAKKKKKCCNLINEGNRLFFPSSVFMFSPCSPPSFLAAMFPICFFQGLFSVEARYTPV